MADRLRTGTVLLAAAVLAGGAAETRAQEMRTLSVSRQLAGETALDVELRYAAGRLYLAPAEGRILYAMDLRYDASAFDPVADFDGRTVELGVEGRGRDIRMGKDGNGAEMRVSLSTRLPLDLSLEFGAGRAEVDLGGMRLRRLDIETGATETRLDVSRANPEPMDDVRIAVGAAEFTGLRLGNLNARRISVEAGIGEVSLDLSGEWPRDGDIEVRMGLGALELRIPRDLGVKLVKKAFLTSLDAPGMERRGDAWYSDLWSSAERRLTIDVDAAFGSVEVVWLR